MATIALTVAVPDQTGAARMLVHYATALRHRGHRVLVLHGPPPTDENGEPQTVLGELAEAGIELHPVPRLRRPLPPLAERDVARAAAPADAIVGFNQRDRATAARAGSRLDIPSILAVQNQHNFWGPGPVPHLKRRFYRRVARDRVTLSVCTSPAVRRELLDMGVDDSKCVVLPNGIDLGPPPTTEQRKRTRARLGLGDRQRVFINVGRLDRQKGQDQLIEAWADAGADRRGARLLLVGGTSEGAQAGASEEFERRLRSRVAALGLNHSIDLLGWRDDVDDLLAASDVAIHPARWEGWPLAVLEAMAAARPVIMSDCSGAPDGHDPERHGPVIPTGDHQALVDAIDHHLDLPDDRLAAIGANGRDLVARHYDIEIIGDRFVDLVEGVIARSR